MSRQYFFSLTIVVLAALLAAPRGGASAQEASGAGEDVLPDRGPVVITSRSLSADNRTNTAVFEGDVVARTGDVVLRADRMKVLYLAEGGGVSRIEAEGGVRLVRGDRVVTAGRAVYFGGERKIVFTEKPRAVQDGNVITGSRMTYLIDEDRSIIEDSKVFLQERS